MEYILKMTQTGCFFNKEKTLYEELGFKFKENSPGGLWVLVSDEDVKITINNIEDLNGFIAKYGGVVVIFEPFYDGDQWTIEIYNDDRE